MFVKVLRIMSQYFIVIYVHCAISRHYFLLNIVVRKTNVAMYNAYILMNLFVFHSTFFKRNQMLQFYFLNYFLLFQLQVRPFEWAAH